MIGLDAGKRFGFRAADQEHVAGFDDGGLAVLFDGNAAGSVVLAPALHPLDFVFLEEEFDAFGVLGDDFGFARQDVGPINFQAGDFEAEFIGIFEVIVDVRVMQKNFGGNAADVQAGATEEGVLLHYDCLQAQFAGADRRYVTAWTATDNRYIVFRHARSPFLTVRDRIEARSRQNRRLTQTFQRRVRMFCRLKDWITSEDKKNSRPKNNCNSGVWGAATFGETGNGKRLTAWEKRQLGLPYSKSGSGVRRTRTEPHPIRGNRCEET